jgi:hypothetical protein
MRIIDLHEDAAAKRVLNATSLFTYVGRRMAGKHPLNGSPLANPYKLTGKSPEKIAESIAQYREWLYAKIKAHDREVMQALFAVTADSVLACWCCDLEGPAVLEQPFRCHAQVIFQAARWVSGPLPPLAELQAGLFEGMQ